MGGTIAFLLGFDRDYVVEFCVGFRVRQAKPLRSLEPGSVGAWLAVPQTQRRSFFCWMGTIGLQVKKFSEIALSIDNAQNLNCIANHCVKNNVVIYHETTKTRNPFLIRFSHTGEVCDELTFLANPIEQLTGSFRTSLF
jgi:hypothetical protein